MIYSRLIYQNATLIADWFSVVWPLQPLGNDKMNVLNVAVCVRVADKLIRLKLAAYSWDKMQLLKHAIKASSNRTLLGPSAVACDTNFIAWIKPVWYFSNNFFISHRCALNVRLHATKILKTTNDNAPLNYLMTYFQTQRAGVTSTAKKELVCV